MSLLHERLGKVVRYDESGQVQVIRWEDAARCCAHPSCAVKKPEAETKLMGADVIRVKIDHQWLPAPVGAQVHTWWQRWATGGGIAGRVTVDQP